MSSHRSAFAGGDQAYLAKVQYGDSAKLEARVALHRDFATSAVRLPDFQASLVAWQADSAILECGCGSGRFWENQYVPRSAAVTVTDLSFGMVDAAVERARNNGFTSVAGHTCDVQDLPFADDRFDVVVANHMLYHVPDPDQAIAELARVVRPDGVVVAATNGYGHMAEMDDAVAEVFGRRTGELYDVFGIDSGEARLRERFASLTWHAFDNDLMVTDPAAAVAYGLSFPPGESATEAEAEAFTAAIEGRFVDGRFRIRTRAGVFVCGDPGPGST